MIRVTIMLLALTATGCLGHGHVIDGAYVPNHDADFDLKNPPCEAGPRPETTAGEVLLRYLGVGGVYIEWEGAAVMTAPFFSNYGSGKVAFGRVEWNEDAIREGLADVATDRVAAILVGHTHYDHFADLPPILTEHATDARVYVNGSGVHMLAPYPRLQARAIALEDHAGRFVAIEGEQGAAPIRVMPLTSSHAPHWAGLHFAKGEVDEPWDEPWEEKKIRKMKEGEVYAFLIDLLSPDLESVRFRILALDAIGDSPAGFTPADLVELHPVDLAILPMPSWFRVDGYPDDLLTQARARHVLIVHYEDFLRPVSKPTRFVATLTDGRANGFMQKLDEVMPSSPDPPSRPDPCACGPCGEAWTMPLPGEWMRFRPRPHDLE